MLGITSTFHVNDDAYNSPDFNEVNLVADATLNTAWDEGASDARDSLVHQFQATMLGLDFSGRIRVEPDDEGYQVVRDAAIFTTVLDVLVLNGPIDENGVEGFRFYAQVFGWNEGQNLTEVIYKDFTLKPCPGDNPPMYVKIAGGVPTFHTIGSEGS